MSEYKLIPEIFLYKNENENIRISTCFCQKKLSLIKLYFFNYSSLSNEINFIENKACVSSNEVSLIIDDENDCTVNSNSIILNQAEDCDIQLENESFLIEEDAIKKESPPLCNYNVKRFPPRYFNIIHESENYYHGYLTRNELVGDLLEKHQEHTKSHFRIA